MTKLYLDIGYIDHINVSADVSMQETMGISSTDLSIRHAAALVEMKLEESRFPTGMLHAVPTIGDTMFLDFRDGRGFGNSPMGLRCLEGTVRDLRYEANTFMRSSSNQADTTYYIDLVVGTNAIMRAEPTDDYVPFVTRMVNESYTNMAACAYKYIKPGKGLEVQRAMSVRGAGLEQYEHYKVHNMGDKHIAFDHYTGTVLGVFDTKFDMEFFMFGCEAPKNKHRTGKEWPILKKTPDLLSNVRIELMDLVRSGRHNRGYASILKSFDVDPAYIEANKVYGGKFVSRNRKLVLD